jgi:hypothetical protein
MNWTKLFDRNLEKILPVRHVMREPGIPIEFGSGRRTWRADYSFRLAQTPFVVEVKLGKIDTPIDGMKVLAYRKLYNIHTRLEYSGLIVTRKDNTNSADLVTCAILRISLLVVDFQKRDDKSIHFSAKLDGSIVYEAICAPLPEDEALESNARGLGIDRSVS